MRIWPVLLLALFLAMGVVQAQPTGWLQLDTVMDERAGDAPASADMVDLFYGSNATHAFFRQDLNGTPFLFFFSYTVYLDYPQGQAYDPDYRLIHTIFGSLLQAWNGTDWVDVEPIVVTTDATNNSLVFEVPFASIGGLGSDMDLWFQNYLFPPAFNITLDRAPDGSGTYTINREVIPNLPGFVLPAFGGALVAAVLVLRRKFLPS
ncbi:MAG: hypothetical protein ACE5JE_07575 [Thermoplasmata archaeon]